jgi:hypothetical protein
MLRPIDVSREKAVEPGDPGAAPMLQWVEIGSLVIDERYQRPLNPRNWAAIRRIAAEFRWSRFSPVLVAPIEGGRFAVIDGQHRAHAAALAGHRSVPAQVVQMPEAEQARAFGAVNGAVIKLTSLALYKAALGAGEDWAVAVDAACREAGCRMLTYPMGANTRAPGDLQCVRLVRRWIAEGKAGTLARALRALKASETGADAGIWGERFLDAWVVAVENSDAASEAALAADLDAVDLDEVEKRAAARQRELRRAGQAAKASDVLGSYLLEALDRVRRAAA